jgi:hypothetical protein
MKMQFSRKTFWPYKVQAGWQESGAGQGEARCRFAQGGGASDALLGSRVGSLTADWEVLAHGHRLRGPSRTGTQRIKREEEPRRVTFDVMFRGTYDKTRTEARLYCIAED